MPSSRLSWRVVLLQMSVILLAPSKRTKIKYGTMRTSVSGYNNYELRTACQGNDNASKSRWHVNGPDHTNWIRLPHDWQGFEWDESKLATRFNSNVRSDFDCNSRVPSSNVCYEFKYIFRCDNKWLHIFLSKWKIENYKSGAMTTAM